MNEKHLLELLNGVSAGSLSPDNALEKLRSLPFADMDFAKVDIHRSLRKGYPETIFCQGKTPEQIAAIAERMVNHGQNVLGTRCSQDAYDAVHALFPEAVHHEAARAFTITIEAPPQSTGTIAIVCAGTSDIPVIFLTGMFPKREDAEGDRIVAGYRWFDKPYDILQLITVIEETLSAPAAKA